MAVNKKDYYEVLGISKNATDSDIKKAYRKLAHEYHPDKGGGDAAKFKEANEAYQTLSDKQKRAQYDQFGHQAEDFGQGAPGGGYSGFEGYEGAQGFDFSDIFNGGGFGDIFETFFTGGGGRARRGPQRGSDLETSVELSLKEASDGVKRVINLFKKDICDACKGSGVASGSKMKTCDKCGGQGQVQETRRTILGQFRSVTTCPKCQGQGKIPEKPCPKCGGEGRARSSKKLEVKIPAGVETGSTIKLTSEGEAGPKGGVPGDLYLHIIVKPDRRFRREGDNLVQEIGISFADAALGITARIETLDGKIEVKIPAGTQSGKVFKIPNKGIKHLHGAGAGDLLVKVNIKTPTKLSSAQKELFKKLKESEGKHGFWPF